MFELTVLLSAITTLVGMLMLNNLPHPSHPLDQVRRFARVTDDKFFLMIEASDPKFDEVETRELLEATHAHAIETVLEDRVTEEKMPAGLVYGLIIVAVASVVPFALAAKARYTQERDAAHPPDSGHGLAAQVQGATREPVLRRPVTPIAPTIDGTVAVGDSRDDDKLYQAARTATPGRARSRDQIALNDADHGARPTALRHLLHPLSRPSRARGDGMVAKRAEELRTRASPAPGSRRPT